jgi:hypothetical protein
VIDPGVPDEVEMDAIHGVALQQLAHHRLEVLGHARRRGREVIALDVARPVTDEVAPGVGPRREDGRGQRCAAP